MTYLDHAATTPMLPTAALAMTAELSCVGNASSLHAAGRRARRVVEESREQVAEVFHARPSEVVFTSGGTESDNLALKGLFWARRAADPRRLRILTTAVEHPAVLDPVQWLADHEGAVVEHLTVDASGRVDATELQNRMAAAPDDVALVSVQWGNSEVGTVQPVAECAEVAHAFGVPIHTDAVQAAAWLDIDFDQVGVDAMSVSGHKVGGPHGVGALLLSRGVSVVPVLHGGGQERDVRSGTLDVPAIASFASALVEMSADREERVARVARLREALVEVVMAAVPDAQLNGPGSGPVGRRLPGHAHFSFPGCHGDSLLLLLDARDIYCSTGSACSAGVAQPSHVLLAMGHNPESARSSLRFSLGHTSSEADVEALANAIGSVVQRARAAGAT